MERDGEKVGNVSNDNTTKDTLCMTSIYPPPVRRVSVRRLGKQGGLTFPCRAGATEDRDSGINKPNHQSGNVTEWRS